MPGQKNNQKPQYCPLAFFKETQESSSIQCAREAASLFSPHGKFSQMKDYDKCVKYLQTLAQEAALF